MDQIALVGFGDSVAGAQAGPLVGRKVANESFLRALLSRSRRRVVVYFGEGPEAAALEERFGAELERRPRWELPAALAAGEVQVLHGASHLDAFGDLVALRDRYAPGRAIVTGQVHSLSYPRMMRDYLRWFVQPPRPEDAVFCSSEAGRAAVRSCLEAVGEEVALRGATLEAACAFPVVPLGLDVGELAFGDGESVRRQLRLGSESRLLLSIGRFSEYDKADLLPLVQAFGTLRAHHARQGRDVHLLLAGASQGVGTRPALEAWAKVLRIGAGLHFLEDFPAERKKDLLAAADIFVAPSDNPQETFGLSVVEAMAAGCAVVASDYDGYRETLADTGILVPTIAGGAWAGCADLMPLLYERPLHLLMGQTLAVDPLALSESLDALLCDDGARQRLGLAAAARARAHYDWSVVIPAYEAVWEACLERAARVQAPAPRASALAFDLERHFRRHPTAWLEEDARVVLGPLGAWMQENGIDHPIQPDLLHLIRPETLRTALGVLADGGCTVAELRARLGGEPVSRACVSRPDGFGPHFLLPWMLKHGLMTFAAAEADG